MALKKTALGDHPWFIGCSVVGIIVGLVVGSITMFQFVTGKEDLPELLSTATQSVPADPTTQIGESPASEDDTNVSSKEDLPELLSTATQSVPADPTTQIGESPASEDDTNVSSIGVLFREDFEDGIADEFVVSFGEWSVVETPNGNKVYEANSLGDFSGPWPRVDFGDPNWTDYIIEYQINFVNFDISDNGASGMGMVMFRRSDTGYYTVVFVPYHNELSFSYQGDGVVGWTWLDGLKPNTEFEVEKNKWYSMRVENIGNSQKAYLDGQLILSATDNSLKQGSLSLEIGPDTIIQFDDIEVLPPNQ